MIKISIITAVFNNVQHLEECFSSVFSQDYPNIEYIVVDGGSTDGSLELIEKNKEKISKYISEPDNGIYDALNKGINMATGDVIGFLHSDDLFNTAETLLNVSEVFETTGCDAVYGDLVYISRTNTSQVIRYWKSKPFASRLLKTGWMPPHPTLFIKRSWYNQNGLFRTDFRIAADYDLILRFFTKPGFKASYIPEVITRMRTGGASNKSLKNIYRKSREDYMALRENKVGGWSALFWKNAQKILQFIRK